MNETSLVKILEEKLQISHLPQEVKDEVVLSLGDNVTKRIQLAVVEKLGDEGGAEAIELLTNNTFEVFMEYLEKNFPEIDTVALSIIDDVVNEFLEESRA